MKLRIPPNTCVSQFLPFFTFFVFFSFRCFFYFFYYIKILPGFPMVVRVYFHARHLFITLQKFRSTDHDIKNNNQKSKTNRKPNIKKIANRNRLISVNRKLKKSTENCRKSRTEMEHRKSQELAIRNSTIQKIKKKFTAYFFYFFFFLQCLNLGEPCSNNTRRL